MRRLILLGALALAGCGASAPKGPTPPAASATPETPHEAEAHAHRSRHHAGVLSFMWMSLAEMQLTAEQKAAVAKVRGDLKAKIEPSRAAGKELAGILADGVAAGKVDRDAADAAIDKLVAAVEALQAAALDGMNQIHAALTPAQRAELAGKVEGRAQRWHESHADDEHDEHKSGGQMAFMRGLHLSDDQRKAIRSNLGDAMKGAPPHDHKDVSEHVTAFAAAFKADDFDARSLDAGSRRAATHVARWGATRLARFCEAAAPVLTAEQRTKLAARLREPGGHDA